MSPGEQGSQPGQGHKRSFVSWGAAEGHSWQSVTYHWGPCAICLLPLLRWCLAVARALVESSSWGWMLDPIGEEGDYKSGPSSVPLSGEMPESIGQLTPALPSLQSHRVKGKSKWLLTLSWCRVSVGPQAGALGELQTEEWVDKPPGPQSHDNAIPWAGLYGGAPGLWLTLVLYSCYCRIPVPVVTHGHTEQVGHGLPGCGHLTTVCPCFGLELGPGCLC